MVENKHAVTFRMNIEFIECSVIQFKRYKDTNMAFQNIFLGNVLVSIEILENLAKLANWLNFKLPD